MTEKLTKVSDFLERLESETTDKKAAKKIREFMTRNDLWKVIESSKQIVEEQPHLQIVYSAVICHECNKTIQSHHRHDYQTCGCPNEATIDGGFEYVRYGAKDISKIIQITYYDTDPHDLLRCFVSWGTYGKDGKQPLSYVLVKDMTDEHIRNVIQQQMGSKWMRTILKNELDYRTEFNLSITENP